MRPPAGRALVAAALLATGGCAERGLVSAPRHSPSTATWLVVAVAVALAGAVIGGLVLHRNGARPRLASVVLAVNAGIVTVGLAVLVGVTIRSWRIAEARTEPGFKPEHSLLRISGIDGDPQLFATAAVFIGALGGLVLLLLVVATQLADSDDRAERAAACLVLGVGLVGSVFAVVLIARGSRWWPVVIGALQFPFLVAGLVSCWPPRRLASVPAPDSGYNGPHG